MVQNRAQMLQLPNSPNSDLMYVGLNKPDERNRRLQVQEARRFPGLLREQFGATRAQAALFSLATAIPAFAGLYLDPQSNEARTALSALLTASFVAGFAAGEEHIVRVLQKTTQETGRLYTQFRRALRLEGGKHVPQSFLRGGHKTLSEVDLFLASPLGLELVKNTVATLKATAG